MHLDEFRPQGASLDLNTLPRRNGSFPSLDLNNIYQRARGEVGRREPDPWFMYILRPAPFSGPGERFCPRQRALIYCLSAWRMELVAP